MVGEEAFMHTQSSEAFSTGLLAKEVTFGIGSLNSDCKSSALHQ